MTFVIIICWNKQFSPISIDFYESCFCSACLLFEFYNLLLFDCFLLDKQPINLFAFKTQDFSIAEHTPAQTYIRYLLKLSTLLPPFTLCCKQHSLFYSSVMKMWKIFSPFIAFLASPLLLLSPNVVMPCNISNGRMNWKAIHYRFVFCCYFGLLRAKLFYALFPVLLF